VQGLIASPSGAWTSGAAVLTAVFPMLLFITVAGALYVLYTKPETVPGHLVRPAERPVSYTAVPGRPQSAPESARAQSARAEGAAPAETSADETAGTSTDEAAGTEGAE
jgi:hypothetical protein